MQEKVTSMGFSVSAEFPPSCKLFAVTRQSLVTAKQFTLWWKFRTNTEAHAGYLYSCIPFLKFLCFTG